MKLLTPCSHVDNIMDLTLSYLKSKEIIALLIDIDNTILDPRTWKIISGFREWLKEITYSENNNDGVSICLVSNTFSRLKKIYTEEKFNQEVIIKAYKPLPFGFRYAIDKLGLKGREGNIAVVGDNTFTDIFGGNLLGLHTIKVNPISPNMATNMALRILYSMRELIYCVQTIPEEAKVLILENGYN